MKQYFLLLVGLLILANQVFAANADYKSVLISATTNAVRVRLPLTDVTGKVRVKEKSSDGFGLPVAPMKTSLNEKNYLECCFDFIGGFGRIDSLKKIPASEFEENQAVQVEVSTNATPDGFQSAVQRLPQFTKTTPHGWVQIQLKQKQRAVGYQAMIYVCIPMNEVLAMDNSPRKTGPAKSKETVFYDFNHKNADLLLDIIQAFGIASQQHNEDMRNILGKILENTR